MRGIASLRKSFELYLRLIDVQIRSQLQYPASFWLDVVGTGVSLAAFFVSLALVLQRFGNLGGWTIREMAASLACLRLPFRLIDMIFAGFDPATFGRHIATRHL